MVALPPQSPEQQEQEMLAVTAQTVAIPNQPPDTQWELRGMTDELLPQCLVVCTRSGEQRTIPLPVLQRENRNLALQVSPLLAVQSQTERVVTLSEKLREAPGAEENIGQLNEEELHRIVANLLAGRTEEEIEATAATPAVRAWLEENIDVEALKDEHGQATAELEEEHKAERHREMEIVASQLVAPTVDKVSDVGERLVDELTRYAYQTYGTRTQRLTRGVGTSVVQPAWQRIPKDIIGGLGSFIQLHATGSLEAEEENPAKLQACLKAAEEIQKAIDAFIIEAKNKNNPVGAAKDLSDSVHEELGSLLKQAGVTLSSGVVSTANTIGILTKALGIHIDYDATEPAPDAPTSADELAQQWIAQLDPRDQRSSYWLRLGKRLGSWAQSIVPGFSRSSNLQNEEDLLAVAKRAEELRSQLSPDSLETKQAKATEQKTAEVVASSAPVLQRDVEQLSADTLPQSDALALLQRQYDALKTKAADVQKEVQVIKDVAGFNLFIFFGLKKVDGTRYWGGSRQGLIDKVESNLRETLAGKTTEIMTRSIAPTAEGSYIWSVRQALQQHAADLPEALSGSDEDLAKYALKYFQGDGENTSVLVQLIGGKTVDLRKINEQDITELVDTLCGKTAPSKANNPQLQALVRLYSAALSSAQLANYDSEAQPPIDLLYNQALQEHRNDGDPEQKAQHVVEERVRELVEQLQAAGGVEALGGIKQQVVEKFGDQMITDETTNEPRWCADGLQATITVDDIEVPVTVLAPLQGGKFVITYQDQEEGDYVVDSIETDALHFPPPPVDKAALIEQARASFREGTLEPMAEDLEGTMYLENNKEVSVTILATLQEGKRSYFVVAYWHPKRKRYTVNRIPTKDVQHIGPSNAEEEE